MNSFYTQFSGNIKSSYSCYDRVIIRGYIRSFFWAGNLIFFLRAMGFRKFSKGVMRIFTDQLCAHIAKEADKHDLTIYWWQSQGGGKDGAKQAFVEKIKAKNPNVKGNFVYCILADMEKARTFSCRTLKKKNGDSYDKLYQVKKLVKHYYIYFHDKLLGGPCYLKLCTYFPFEAEFYFNGHNYVRLVLDKKGRKYRMSGNAFTDLEDPKLVEQLAFQLTGQMVQSRIDYWMNRFFKFSKGTYSTRSKYLKHEWYLSQTEVCTNFIFKSSRFATNLFLRLLEKFMRLGQPESLIKIFSKRRTRRQSREFKNTWRTYDEDGCIKHWFGRNAIKLYNKLGNFLRLETTINDPKSLGLKKPLAYLQTYLKCGMETNGRLANCLAEVDTRSIGSDELEALNQPVTTESGQRIPAPDLRNERQMALGKELLRTGYSVHGFKTRDLLKSLKTYFRNSTQIRYELRKLIARGLVEKKKSQSFYRVTPLGYQVLWLRICAQSYFEKPMIAMSYRTREKMQVSQPLELERGYDRIDEGLRIVTKELFIKAA